MFGNAHTSRNGMTTGESGAEQVDACQLPTNVDGGQVESRWENTGTGR
jgi:hypothetical protein